MRFSFVLHRRCQKLAKKSKTQPSLKNISEVFPPHRSIINHYTWCSHQSKQFPWESVSGFCTLSLVPEVTGCNFAKNTPIQGTRSWLCTRQNGHRDKFRFSFNYRRFHDQGQTSDNGINEICLGVRFALCIIKSSTTRSYWALFWDGGHTLSSFWNQKLTIFVVNKTAENLNMWASQGRVYFIRSGSRAFFRVYPLSLLFENE